MADAPGEEERMRVMGRVIFHRCKVLVGMRWRTCRVPPLRSMAAETETIWERVTRIQRRVAQLAAPELADEEAVEDENSASEAEPEDPVVDEAILQQSVTSAVAKSSELPNLGQHQNEKMEAVEEQNQSDASVEPVVAETIEQRVARIKQRVAELT